MPNELNASQESSLPLYVVESDHDVIKLRGRTFPGTRAENYKNIFLYKLPLDVAEQEIANAWPASKHAKDGRSPRVSPTGNESWWICTRGSSAKWPKTGERSTGKPLAG